MIGIPPEVMLLLTKAFRVWQSQSSVNSEKTIDYMEKRRTGELKSFGYPVGEYTAEWVELVE
ncbi:hypothetical protein GJ744_004420 [Endocarpon pusillum]|uniref:Uncharacterized protein n=1 Tax=Endocarpon pusillum TaxID=364733 RepID=A0A8H7ARF5_9EURO|nr:hypothetical protein GJ744_004420 [Endocarpon pusillum]